ncbi:SRPBCC domain-containing protein [Niabella yanshanensis]|uniref:SRPBCC domain-containing protein n=1 Tax=Niabella yanshanensis TaxID=577386 RepID=A0ABZ0W6K1_9BACT|nr:SRPBCC domain-containing protein [Niabella yanshanensis]WQD38159.1 SRPBCC domain-containing protein [Niabella yanshanensis]
MKDLNFSIVISAPVEKVWETLWNDHTYRKWTAPFNPGSYMESDWQVGGKTLFLDAERNGMLSTIKTLESPRLVEFSHYGELNKGVEDTTSDRVRSYAGAVERYELLPDEKGTLLKVLVQTNDEYEQMMNDGFTKSLQELKELAEYTDSPVNTKHDYN